MNRAAGNSESGMALVAVLCLIFSVSVMLGAMVVLSQIGAITSAGFGDVMRSNYIAEGAANRIRYLIEADRRANPSAGDAETDYEEYDYERYLPDGVDRTLDYYGTPVKYRILNGRAGMPVMEASCQNTLRQLRNGYLGTEEICEKMDTLKTRIDDYVDSDDSIGEDGLEEEEYEELGYSNLPRNSDIRFREELLWIPGFTDVFPLDENGRLTSVRLTSLAADRQNPDFYSTDYGMLTAYGNLEPEKAGEVMNALKIWRRDRTKLEDQLDVLLLAQLRQKFSFQPSSYYTIQIENASPAGKPGARLSQTFEASGVGGPSDGIVRYLDWMRY